MSLKIVAVLPARMGSTRFPGKPVEKIMGLPMIEHVRRRVERVDVLADVFVATCDDEIRSVVEDAGGKVIMTKDTHERCTDRIEEASHHFDADVVVNVQGDEPLVPESAIRDVVSPFLSNSEVKSSCLVYPIHNLEELTSPNIVKTTLSRSGRMLYLSRSCIPGREVDPNRSYFKQSGIMAFRKDFLHEFSCLEPTPLEEKESVDMLRILEHDGWIQAVVSDNETLGVDIPDHIQMVEDRIRANPAEMRIFDEISSAP